MGRLGFRILNGLTLVGLAFAATAAGCLFAAMSVVFTRPWDTSTYFISIRPEGVRFVRQAARANGPGNFRPDTRRLDVLVFNHPSGGGSFVFNEGPTTQRRRFGFAASHRDSGYKPLPDPDRHVIRATTPGSILFSYSWILVPYWALIALGLFPLVLRLMLSARNRRAVSPHACKICGYDLRATPGRCPECGAASPDHVPAFSTSRS